MYITILFIQYRSFEELKYCKDLPTVLYFFFSSANLFFLNVKMKIHQENKNKTPIFVVYINTYQRIKKYPINKCEFVIV